MPPMPEPASRRRRPLRAGMAPRENSPATPMSSACPGAHQDGDVAAVVDEGAIERRSRCHVCEQLVGDGAGHRRHRRDEHVGERAQAATMRRATAPSTRRPLLRSGGAAGPARRTARAGSREARGRRRRRPRAAPPASPQAFSTTSIGPCDRCRRSPVSCWMTGGANMRAHPILASAATRASASAGCQRLQRAARDLAATAFIAATAAWPAGVRPSMTSARILGIGRLAHVAARGQPADHAGDGGRVHAREAAELVLRHRAAGRRAWRARRTASASPRTAP